MLTDVLLDVKDDETCNTVRLQLKSAGEVLGGGGGGSQQAGKVFLQPEYDKITSKY